jgi:chitobiase/beta-hexosaminidase-like protein
MRTVSARWFVLVWLCGVLYFSASAQDSLNSDRPVSARQPVQEPTIELRVNHPAKTEVQTKRLHKGIVASSSASPWLLLVTLPGTIIHDLSFPTATVGFAAAELGQVWKTTDGGSTWTEVMNLGFPYYWYGVHALDANNVIISGFNDQNSTTGVVRWSHDGGATWTGDIVLGSNWGTRVRFADSSHGIILDSISGSTAQYTTDGGAAATDWTQVTVAPVGYWFGNEFSLLSDQHAAASGIDYCSSSDAGAAWTCGPSIDSVFDGPVFFADDNHGWVGGGEISPGVEGWIHGTTDGGATWSGRLLDGPLPIREILFLSPSMGWAAGGNIYTNVGGIYFSSDGGQTWSLDLDTDGNEMDACDTQPVGDAYQVWCAGYNSAFTGTVYGVQGAATPSFSPAAGAYTSAQSVIIADTTTNPTIYYTTDGTTPTTSSTPYTGAIAVSSSETIQAIALATGYSNSLVASATYTINLPPADFAVAVAPASLTISSGQPGKTTVTVTPQNGFASAVSFSCSGLPSGASCSFSPTTVTPSGAAATTTLTVSKTAAASSVVRRNSRPLFPGAALAIGLCCLGWKRRRRVQLLLAVCVCGLGLIAGCGSGSSSTPPPPSTVTVTATSESLQHTATFSLTVQ